jgi:hypothetical protein
MIILLILALGRTLLNVSQDNNEKHDIKNKELQILDRWNWLEHLTKGEE